MTYQRSGGKDKRGSYIDRRNRKLWLLSTESGHDYGNGFVSYGGNGETVPCVYCGQQLDYNTVEADRIVPGGSYARSNVQPADRHCNASRSNDAYWLPALAYQ